MRNLFAYTRPTISKGYCGYVSVNEVDGGVEVSVRTNGDPTGNASVLALTSEQAKDFGRSLAGTMRIRFGFSTSDWWVSRVIRFFTRAKVSHAFVLLEGTELGDLVLEAEWCGLKLSTRAALTRGSTRIVALVDPIPGMAGPVEKATRAALSWLDVPYDYAGLFGMAWVAFGRWLGKKWKNPLRSARSMFCSDAVVALVLQPAGWPGAAELERAIDRPRSTRRVPRVARASGIAARMLKRLIGALFRRAFNLPEGSACTRPAPHECRVNGSCNGFPRPLPREPAPAPIDASITDAGMAMLVPTERPRRAPAAPPPPLPGSWEDQVARARQRAGR